MDKESCSTFPDGYYERLSSLYNKYETMKNECAIFDGYTIDEFIEEATK